eukprot:gnl/Trimastix_PCT/4253.p1 GENE.gnl/Trimastix_PCT/4253~~gnl/Trimastix_PCT/4253.p1  ORF type:complete len:1149 (+),score=234.62 gnl/Trimastix_PCT/4253:65-3511(+)
MMTLRAVRRTLRRTCCARPGIWVFVLINVVLLAGALTLMYLLPQTTIFGLKTPLWRILFILFGILVLTQIARLLVFILLKIFDASWILTKSFFFYINPITRPLCLLIWIGSSGILTYLMLDHQDRPAFVDRLFFLVLGTLCARAILEVGFRYLFFRTNRAHYADMIVKSLWNEQVLKRLCQPIRHAVKKKRNSRHPCPALLQNASNPQSAQAQSQQGPSPAGAATSTLMSSAAAASAPAATATATSTGTSTGTSTSNATNAAADSLSLSISAPPSPPVSATASLLPGTASPPPLDPAALASPAGGGLSTPSQPQPGRGQSGAAEPSSLTRARSKLLVASSSVSAFHQWTVQLTRDPAASTGITVALPTSSPPVSPPSAPQMSATAAMATAATAAGVFSPWDADALPMGTHALGSGTQTGPREGARPYSLREELARINKRVKAKTSLVRMPSAAPEAPYLPVPEAAPAPKKKCKISTVEEAQLLAEVIYHNLLGPPVLRTREYILQEDLHRLFRRKDVPLVLDALRPASRDHIELDDLVRATCRILRNRRTLANALSNRDNNIGRALHSVLVKAFWIAIVFISLLILGVDYTAVIVPSATLLLGASFAFGNVARSFFDSFALLFVARLYDIGEILEVDGEFYIVQEIHMLHTKLATLTNLSYFMPNSVLFSKSIANLNRSSQVIFRPYLDLSYRTTADQLAQLGERLRAFIHANNNWFEPNFLFKVSEIDLKKGMYRVLIQLTLTPPFKWSNWEWLDIRNDVYTFLLSSMQELHIEYAFPLSMQPSVKPDSDDIVDAEGSLSDGSTSPSRPSVSHLPQAGSEAHPFAYRMLGSQGTFSLRSAGASARRGSSHHRYRSPSFCQGGFPQQGPSHPESGQACIDAQQPAGDTSSVSHLRNYIARLASHDSLARLAIAESPELHSPHHPLRDSVVEVDHPAGPSPAGSAAATMTARSHTSATAGGVILDAIQSASITDPILPPSPPPGDPPESPHAGPTEDTPRSLHTPPHSPTGSVMTSVSCRSSARPALRVLRVDNPTPMVSSNTPVSYFPVARTPVDPISSGHRTPSYGRMAVPQSPNLDFPRVSSTLSRASRTSVSHRHTLRPPLPPTHHSSEPHVATHTPAQHPGQPGDTMPWAKRIEIVFPQRSENT